MIDEETVLRRLDGPRGDSSAQSVVTESTPSPRVGSSERAGPGEADHDDPPLDGDTGSADDLGRSHDEPHPRPAIDVVDVHTEVGAVEAPRLARHQIVLDDGHLVGVTVAGRGVPLVVVHGFSAEGFLYAQSLSRLVKMGFRVVKMFTIYRKPMEGRAVSKEDENNGTHD